jgi:hypothetical protein
MLGIDLGLGSGLGKYRYPAPVALSAISPGAYSLWDPRLADYADGVAVDSEPDQGPWGVAAAAVTTARPVMATTGINGRKAIFYNGTTNRQDVNGIIAAGGFSGADKPITFIAVVQFARLGGQDSWFSLGRTASSNPTHRARLTSINIPQLSRADDTPTTLAATTPIAIQINKPYVIGMRFDGTRGDVWLNGTNLTGWVAMDLGTLTLDRATWGCRGGASNVNFFQGWLGVRGAVPLAVSDAQMPGSMSWFAREYEVGF